MVHSHRLIVSACACGSEAVVNDHNLMSTQMDEMLGLTYVWQFAGWRVHMVLLQLNMDFMCMQTYLHMTTHHALLLFLNCGVDQCKECCSDSPTGICECLLRGITIQQLYISYPRCLREVTWVYCPELWACPLSAAHGHASRGAEDVTILLTREDVGDGPIRNAVGAGGVAPPRGASAKYKMCVPGITSGRRELRAAGDHHKRINRRRPRPLEVAESADHHHNRRLEGAIQRNDEPWTEGNHANSSNIPRSAAV